MRHSIHDGSRDKMSTLWTLSPINLVGGFHTHDLHRLLGSGCVEDGENRYTSDGLRELN